MKLYSSDLKVCFLIIPECFDAIVIDKECQVQASSQYDDDSAPFFAINDPEITQIKKGKINFLLILNVSELL